MPEYEGKWLQVLKKYGWEYVHRHNDHGIVAILPVNVDEVIFIDQFRIPLQNRVVELPCGLVDVGEDFEVAARRELLEETGYEARHWTRLVDLAVSPGLSTEVITLFRASGLTKVGDGGGVSSEEDITVHVVKTELIKEWLEDRIKRNYYIHNTVYSSLFFL